MSLLANHGLLRIFASFDADYQAVLTKATALGYSLPSFSQQILQNQLVLDLKSAGIWSKLDILYVPANDSGADFARINWVDPNNYLSTLVNSPTFTSNVGFTTNGSSSYINTGWSPSAGVKYTQNNAGIFIENFINAGVNSRSLYGSQITSNGSALQLNPRNGSGNLTYAINDSSTNQGGLVATATGFLHIKRTSSTAKSAYKNGSLIFSHTASSLSRSTSNLLIGAWLQNATVIQYRNIQFSIFGVGESLNGLESSLYTAYQTYFTSL